MVIAPGFPMPTRSRPGYYSVLLPDYQVKVELTATARAGFHRYTFPATTNGHVVVDLQHGIGNKRDGGPADH
jgi:putative alpha-1,2-mannosidase